MSTATDSAASTALAVPLMVCCQSRAPSPANFATMKSRPVPVFVVPPAASTLPWVSTATDSAESQRWRAVEGLLPEQGPVGGELRDREVSAGAGIRRWAGGEHVALGVHRHRFRPSSNRWRCR